MSEETTVAAPEAPAVVEPVVETPAVEPVETIVPTPAAEPHQDGASVRTQRRRAAQARGEETRAKAEASRERALDQPREPAGEPEGGQFVEAVAEAPAEPEATAAELTAPVEPVVSDPVETPAVADAPAEGFVRIELAEDHPHRKERGRTHYDIPAEQESEIRGALNALARQSATKAEMAQERERNAVLEAQLKARAGDLPYQATPEMEFLLQEIEGKYSPETAALMKEGLEALNTRKITEAGAEAAAHASAVRMSEVFIGNVEMEAATRIPIWMNAGEQQRVMNLLDQYGEHIDQRNSVNREQGRQYQPPTADEFWNWMAPIYASDPRVTANVRQGLETERKQKEEAIRADERGKAAAAEAAKLKDAADRHSTRPPSTSSHSSVGRTSDPESGPAPKTRKERRRALQQRVGTR